GADVEIPEGARMIDVAGRSVMPGIVEGHSHMGFKQLWTPTTGRNNNELSKPINAEVRTIDGLNSDDIAFQRAVAGGITTMVIITGSQSPNSGQAMVAKMRGGTVDDMFLAHGGMKFAFREWEWEGFPQSSEENRELLGSELQAAQAYLAAWARYRSGDASGPPPARDLKLEALGKVVTREWVAGAHAHSEEDMRIFVDLEKAFDLDLYIIHGDACGALAEELVAEGIPVSFGPVLPGTDREHPELEGAVRFVNLGGLLSFQQDHPDGPQYYLRTAASLFVRKGMSEDEALRALTINGAKIFRLEDRIGSLEVGKDADFVILSGPPLDIESLVEQVFVEGREVYNRATGFSVYRSR
ncbi:MAG: amidohydrolase family protein, partial [Gemmatimonadota bacterium]